MNTDAGVCYDSARDGTKWKGSAVFGYVVANVEKLTALEKERYQSVYCGLCRGIAVRHSQACRLTLSYDMAFLALLLSSLDRTELSDEHPFRCPLHPLQRRQAFSNRHTAYAADLNVMLAYYQRMDDWEDSRSVTALAQAKVFARHIPALSKAYPRQAKAVADGLGELSECEKAGETNPDRPAAAFGRLLGEVFVPEGHPQEEGLRALGDKLGRFIYIMDAAVDLKKDIQHERYNPLVAIESSRHDEILGVLMADCVAAFSALPILRDKPLMENILYSGVWSRRSAAKKGEPA